VRENFLVPDNFQKENNIDYLLFELALDEEFNLLLH
jgi:hypothetical protein